MENRNLKNLIFDSFKKYLDIELSESEVSSFIKYANILKETNKVMNLTAIMDDEGIAVKHFVDSCFILKADICNKNDNNYQKSVIDVGTGAGFPGIPMAILQKNWNFTLTDSLNKRIMFLQKVVDELSLNNVKLVHSRAEDLGHNKSYREKYDIAVARGVTKLNSLFEYLSPFVKKDGIFLLHKLSNIDEEMIEANNSMKLLNVEYLKKYNYSLIETEPERAIFEFRKTNVLKNIYPRKAGMPTKSPL